MVDWRLRFPPVKIVSKQIENLNTFLTMLKSHVTPPKTQNISEGEILLTLKKVGEYQAAKILDLARNELLLVWPKLERKPSLKKLSNLTKAELLYRCGVILSWHSHTSQMFHYASIARDWLTESRELYAKNKQIESVAHTEIELAVSYWRSGEFCEALLWIENAYNHPFSPTSEIRLKIITGYLLILNENEEYEKALSIIKDNDPEFESTSFINIGIQYYGNSAFTMKSLGNLPEAHNRYKKVINLAETLGNKISQATAENNLGNLYAECGSFDTALYFNSLASTKCKELSCMGLYAFCLDSRANIYLKFGDLSRALYLSNQAINILERGEDFAIYCDSLWTKFLILAQSGNAAAATDLYIKLLQIADIRLPSKKTKKYRDSFQRLFSLNPQEIQIYSQQKQYFVNGVRVAIPDKIQAFGVVWTDQRYFTDFSDLAVIGTYEENSPLPVAIRDRQTNETFTGFLTIEKDLEIYAIDADDVEVNLITFERAEILGSIVGYCKFNEVENVYDFFELNYENTSSIYL